MLKGVNLRLKKGETVGVVGVNGSGKTTLALIMSGLLKPDAGDVFLRGHRAWPNPRREMIKFYKKVQIIRQHPETAFNPRWKMRRSILEPFRLHSIPFTEDSLDLLLDQVGLGPDVPARFPGQLSGGELQRLAIARALALKPDYIILDEPTSMVDAITQAQIMRLLKDIQFETGIGYLFISHDHQLVRLFSHRMYVLEQGLLKTYSTREKSGP